ncbi:polysaccharide deacetylase family protein [Helicovermis profundi]|uniref:NodB homology domain-containing protein n=1 Tax=Helicovermis profundi TaxID=3065157 RepID=A0AAU9E0X8_9FIRM|nr:hypothetical protein HLPR_03900 [Clostridia bacterium S502]
MKKGIVVVLAITLLLSGCSLKQVNEENIDLSKENANNVEVSTKNVDVKNVENDKDTENVEAKEIEKNIDNTTKIEPNSTNVETTTSKEDSNKEDVKEATNFTELSTKELKKIKANELGEIMVIMYHGLSKKNATYSRTAESFKKDLQELYDSGFRLLSLKDFVNGNITTKAGYTPVVLTFDDGNRSNFNILIDENGDKEIDPNSVVGIMEDFYDKHNDFGLEATFFLNGGTPFGQKNLVKYKLNHIINVGMDIGNHSYHHGHFKTMDADKIENTLANVVKEYEPLMNGYKINTLALPFGERPKNDAAKEKLVSGSYDGTKYNNIAILNVGWRPSWSAYSKRFNPKSILRVQSGDGKLQLRHWLDLYKEKPRLKFISDGNPKTITIREGNEKYLSKESLDEYKIVTY